MERSYCLHVFSGSFNRVPAAYVACLCFPDGKDAGKGRHFTLSAQERAYACPSNPAQAELMLAAFSVFQQIFPQIFVRKTWQGGTAFNLSYLIAAARPACRVFLAQQNSMAALRLFSKISSPISFACGIDSRHRRHFFVKSF